MKIVKKTIFINQGKITTSSELNEILSEIDLAISKVTWESDTEFILNPTRKGNGVKPIKDNFVNELRKFGWNPESRMSLAKGMNPGPIDAVKNSKLGNFAVEWETGNISSSHRALNKMAVGIIQNQIVGGILVLPMKNCAQYLTDRVGNYEEIEPYFTLYQSLKLDEGYMAVIGIEHDKESSSIKLIPKGNDGYAKK